MLDVQEDCAVELFGRYISWEKQQDATHFISPLQYFFRFLQRVCPILVYRMRCNTALPVCWTRTTVVQ